MEKIHKLLSRDEFRNAVLNRDGNKCVFCDEDAKDAHHIIERRLWSDGGYYLANGASVCELHHIDCESTKLSVEDVRKACGITKVLTPEHLYEDQRYDKWGNPILANGNRLKGELFFDESVQKVLKLGDVLHLFVNQVKYPRTYHAKWSQGINDDDRVIDSMDAFKNKRVIVTVKMDGENTSMYNDCIHARSVDGRSHPSRDWVKNLWSKIRYDIEDGWRICGENLFAQHSISYADLPSYFMGFSIWDNFNKCLNWDDTQDYFKLLGIVSVPILYDGIYDEKIIRKLWDDKDWATHEGYVVRLADSFSYSQFKYSCLKFVRKDHVQTTKHWAYGQAIIPNGMVK